MNLASPTESEFEEIVEGFLGKYVEPQLKAQMPGWSVKVHLGLAYDKRREDVDTSTLDVAASAWQYPSEKRKWCRCLFKGGRYGGDRILILRCNYIRYMQTSNQRVSERHRSLEYLLKRCEPLLVREWIDTSAPKRRRLARRKLNT